MVSDEKIVKRLREILDSADLNVTTEKTIRTQLQEEFEIDLSQRKKFIRHEVEVYLTEKQGDDGDNDDDEEEEEKVQEKAKASKKRKATQKSKKDVKDKDKKEKRTGGGLTKVCALSDELASLLGQREMPRTDVVKSIWGYIREHNLQDPSNKRLINCDEALRSLLKTDATDMFQLNKLLSAHIKSIPGPDGVTPPPKKQKTEGGTGGKGGFSQPLPMSDALIGFLGAKEKSLPRSEVVKRMWAYIKENNLQDPKDRRKILSDESLKKLLNVDSFNGFGMTKLLSPHFLKNTAAEEAHDEEDGHGEDMHEDHEEEVDEDGDDKE